MTTIATRLQAVRGRIQAAAALAGRSAQDIRLIAVSKTFAPGAIIEAHAAGQVAFGENYLQEALGKITELDAFGRERQASSLQAGPLLRPLEERVASPDGQSSGAESDTRPSAGVRQRDVDGAREAGELAHGSASSVARPEAPRSGASSPQAGPLLLPLEWRVASPDGQSSGAESDTRPSAGVASPQAGPLLLPLEWHFIGPIQSNKTRQIAERFQWVHTLDRLKIAERLAAGRPSSLPLMDVCIQVNISSEDSKSGVRPDDVLALAQATCRLPGIRLRGLMAIPEATLDTALQRARFRQVRELRDDIVRSGIPLDMLS